MKSKKIIVFSLSYDPFFGGAELALREIMKRNIDLEFDVITLRFDSKLPKFEKKENINIYRIGFSKQNPTPKELVKFPMYLVKILYPILAFIKATSLYKKNKHDGIWAMMAYAGFGAVIFKIFYPKVPYILSLQEGDSVGHMTKRFRIRLVLPLLKMVFNKPNIIQVISNYLGVFARDMGFRGNIEVVPNGVDLSKFKTKNACLRRQEKLKVDLNGKDKIILITTSRLVEKNAVDDVIKALKFLPSNVIFKILGDGPLLESLKNLVSDLGFEKRVEFLGYIDQDNLSKHLQEADIFIRPSLTEGMGSSFIEAMSVGIPVITTSVGGIVDFLFDHSMTSGYSTGLFCEVKNPESIVRKVKLLISNNKLRTDIIENASKMVREKYDWNKIAKDMREKVFNKIL